MGDVPEFVSSLPAVPVSLKGEDGSYLRNIKKMLTEQLWGPSRSATVAKELVLHGWTSEEDKEELFRVSLATCDQLDLRLSILMRVSKAKREGHDVFRKTVELVKDRMAAVGKENTSKLDTAYDEIARLKEQLASKSTKSTEDEEVSKVGAKSSGSAAGDDGTSHYQCMKGFWFVLVQVFLLLKH
jgi:hypothetical protein